jgi:hypothetical protein
MEMVRMVTTSPHVYAGQQLAVGDEFDCEKPHVVVMTTLGRARLKEAAPTANTYRTRDMAAVGSRRRGPPK